MQLTKNNDVTISEILDNLRKKVFDEQEIKYWKETCEILKDQNIMKSIEKSLKQISEGKGIPLSKLK